MKDAALARFATMLLGAIAIGVFLFLDAQGAIFLILLALLIKPTPWRVEEPATRPVPEMERQDAGYKARAMGE